MLMTGLEEGRQLWLLLYSCGLGVALGLLFEAFDVAVKIVRRRRRMVFIIDVSYLALASLISFYFSLAVMDGMLHPLLFGGSLFGFVVERMTIGRLIGGFLYRAVRCVQLVTAQALRLVSAPLCSIMNRINGAFVSLGDHQTENVQKARKKRVFFRKKT